MWLSIWEEMKKNIVIPLGVDSEFSQTKVCFLLHGLCTSRWYFQQTAIDKQKSLSVYFTGHRCCVVDWNKTVRTLVPSQSWVPSVFSLEGAQHKAPPHIYKVEEKKILNITKIAVLLKKCLDFKNDKCRPLSPTSVLGTQDRSCKRSERIRFLFFSSFYSHLLDKGVKCCSIGVHDLKSGWNGMAPSWEGWGSSLKISLSVSQGFENLVD